ncbi:hypothetical protein [Kitasatospora sp. SUK 42]|uniref:hypothetical protein n=1 Tax=Kitasatospora sp. SUK 42 TaxID=1588882 RepID=UPI0018CBA649|nr:hypothetical protein [Kitasatospora sp. SUK 42]MBV2153468.1 hypothetical protein [Kitasatospora sp. SUK 42]
MVAVPVSARWLSGMGVVVFLVPVVAMAVVIGPRGTVLYVCGLLCAAACAVPAFFRYRNRFRVACAASGMGIAAVSVPPGLVGIVALILDGTWILYLAFLALPTTAIAGLIAGFQRARGRECGRRAAVVAWLLVAVTVIGWAYLTVHELTWEQPLSSRSF